MQQDEQKNVYETKQEINEGWCIWGNFILGLP